MDWIQLALAVPVAAIVLWLPGGVLAWLAGLRGMLLIALAPGFGASTVALAATAAPLVGLGWSPLALAAATLVLGAIVSGLRFLLARGGRFALPPLSRPWLVVLGVVLAAGLLSWRVGQTLGSSEAISQTFDNIFHLNAVRFILDTADASSMSVGLLTTPAGLQSFYPAEWHAVVALVVQLTGVSIPLAVNAVTIMVAALVWPIGAMLLARTLFGGGTTIMVATAVLSTALPQFPLLLMQYGVLYPLQLGFALLPGALAALALALGIGPSRTRTVTALWGAVLVAGLLPGLAVAHPGAFVAWLALGAPLIVVALVRGLRAGTRSRRAALLGAFAVYLVAGVVLVKLLRPPAEARGWPPTDSLGGALLDALTLGAYGFVPAFLVAALVVLGVVASLTRRSAGDIAAVGVWAVAVLLYVVVAGCSVWVIRDVLTGSWYNNIPRLAALLPIAVVPLAARGAGAIWSWSTRKAGRVLPRGSALWWTAAAAATAALVAVAQVGPMPAAVRQGHESHFALDDNSALLSPDELALIERLDETVPPGAVIAGSPWTGAALAYALSGRVVLMPHTLMYETEDIRAINGGLADASEGDDVCAAVDETGVGYVLDFGTREVPPGFDGRRYPGLDGLAESETVELIDQEGDAKLYRVVGCG